jgi:hypothetical protein
MLPNMEDMFNATTSICFSRVFHIRVMAMTRIWKTREKQIEVVALNISSMFGSIKGISGNDLASASFLELPQSPSEEN